jgi:hypothetical protein
MWGTYSQLLLHVVFSTKGRVPPVTAGVSERLHPYMGGIVRAERGVRKGACGRGWARAGGVGRA